MKVKIPKSFNELPKSERQSIEDYCNKIINDSLDKEDAELQVLYMKMTCMILKDNFGMTEDDLLRFIGSWGQIYRKNRKFKTSAEQSEWLETEMKRIFPTGGFPDMAIERYKKIGADK